MSKKNLTQQEQEARNSPYDLTTGQFIGTSKNTQDIEQAFLNSFFKLSRQSLQHEPNRHLFCHSASLSFGVIADYLLNRFHDKTHDKCGNENSLALIEPFVDNIHDIFAAHKIACNPVPDQWLTSDFKNMTSIQSSVVCLALPNNPTGAMIAEDRFRQLVKFCHDTGKTLIIDACFRAFLPNSQNFDAYKIMKETGTSFIIIEDTGKIIYADDKKASFMLASPDIHEDLNLYHINYMANSNPVPLRELTPHLDALSKSGKATFKDILKNRSLADNTVVPFGLKPMDSNVTSFRWYDTSALMPGQNFVDLCASAKVRIVSGETFFWSDPAQGRNFVRMALYREPVKFAEAMQALGAVLAAEFPAIANSNAKPDELKPAP